MTITKNLKFKILIFFVACIAGCKAKSPEPVALERDEPCSYCKMAISEKQYAAEFIDHDGKVFKFDDLGCMVNFIRSRKVTNVAAYFVIDFDQRGWLKAEDAFFVRSSEFNTPMGGGIVAFKDQATAQQAVDKYRGKLLRFQEVLNQ